MVAPAGAPASPATLCGPPTTSVIEAYEYTDYTKWTFDCTAQWAGAMSLATSSVMAVGSLYYATM